MSSKKVALHSMLVWYQTGTRIIHAVRAPIEKFFSLKNETDLEKDMDLDSLDKVEAIMAIEKLCTTDEIPEEVARNFKNFGDLYNYVLNNYREDAIYDIEPKSPNDPVNQKLIEEIREKFQIPNDKLNDHENMSDLVKEALSLIEEQQ